MNLQVTTSLNRETRLGCARRSLRKLPVLILLHLPRLRGAFGGLGLRGLGFRASFLSG